MSLLLGCRQNENNADSTPGNADRAVQARLEKDEELRNLFARQGLDFEAPFDLFIRAFKKEKSLEVWVREPADAEFLLLKKIPVCGASGQLGPKRKEGDKQVPEGFYHIDRFNPKSRFYLSLGLNYPNASDRVLADQKHPGSDVFIHGKCKSIGCLAIKDEPIKELYLIAEQAEKFGHSKIQVHIFPTRLTMQNMSKLAEERPGLEEFWRNLRPGYEFFEKTKRLPRINVSASGRYEFFQ